MAKDLIGRMQEIIDEKSLLKHPFYQAWNEGTLPVESLREYAKQYYHFEAAYPRFLSGVHARCEDRSVRQLLLDNLWDEEYGDENHVELWLRFCDALGLDRDEVVGSEPVEATRDLVDSFVDMTSEGSLAGGAAALYAFESQVPKVADAKIKGLRDFYDMDDARSLSFFTVHSALDVEHSEAEAEMVGVLAGSKDEEAAALEATETATEKLWKFLDGVY